MATSSGSLETRQGAILTVNQLPEAGGEQHHCSNQASVEKTQNQMYTKNK